MHLRQSITYVVFVLILALFPCSLHAQNAYLHHDLKVTLYPEEHRISAIDAITLPKDFTGAVTFSLHKGLRPSSPTPIVRIIKQSEVRAAVPAEQYKVVLPPGLRTFTVVYAGVVHHPVVQTGAEQARGFQDTPGTISDTGVYLSGASLWYPDLGTGLVTFDLDVKLPAAWDAVSQGERSQHDVAGNLSFVRWRSPEPQDSIFLIAAPFTEYVKPAGRALAMVFLRTPDQGLADKYLAATTGYLDLYSRLITPYPYKKFALVENFWETGFGMPSFTLLGPKVIRLPFIINTSYPHEILHNWWGNSVFPDYEKGNWSEGLTAYLADHLMKEQQGAGPDYRVNTLQKYADYVLGNKDFPLTEFRSRHSSSSEAIGYGKSLMFFHMLRQKLGDETFRLGLQDFAKKNTFRVAGFDDLRTSFETISGKDLTVDFEQWVTRIGAPQLKISRPAVTPEDQGFLITAVIEQTQAGDAYQLQVPVAVTMAGSNEAFQTTVAMTTKRTELTLHVPVQPLRLDVDPEFDLFRRLDRDESPAAISQALGAGKMLVILPASADAKLLAAYRAFARSLAQSGPDTIAIKLDSEIRRLPADRAIAVLGWENRFVKALSQAWSRYDVSMKKSTVLINRAEIAKQDHSFVFTTRLPENKDLAALFIASDQPRALAGLAQKLPHYHKYSYLAFEGQGPENVAKGRWPVLDSPLTQFIPASNTTVEIAGLAAREPLASLEPVFSQERIMNTISLLTGTDMGGRGFGSEGLDKAADFIAQRFEGAGLVPGGDAEGSWFQAWEDSGGDPARTVMMKNVIGVIPGKRQDLKEQSIVVGAHYDHLGLGWPETRDNGAGKVHPGADDNASGVAALVELARVLARGPRPDRTIVFIAFTGEEAGRRGSAYYVANSKRYPVKQCRAMVNLDTIGRLGKKKLLVLGSGSAREWVHIFRGAGFVTNVEIESVAAELDSSDQKSFQEAGVPAVQLFSGPNLDYHRTTDTADKIDPLGLVKIASVAREVIEYLAGRETPLTTAGSPPAGARTPAPSERKVSLGTIPDFAFHGKGFRISGIVSGSPAETAGLKEGDVITAVNATAITSLPDYSNFLKTLGPGDTVTITLTRDGTTMTLKAVVRGK